MTLSRFLVVLSLSIGLLGGSTVTSQALDSSEVVPKVIDGAVEPENIPYAVKIGSLMSLYDVAYRESLLAKLSNRDAVLLETIVQLEAVQQDNERRSYGGKFRKLCAKKELLDVVMLAREYDRIADEFLTIRESRYRKSFAGLSASGRQSIDDYVNANITPQTSFSTSDSIELAQKFPDEFKLNFDILCQAHLTGKLPDRILEQLDGPIDPPGSISLPKSRQE